MWRKLFKRFGKRVVMTVDYDGEIRYRFAKFTEYGVITRNVCDKVLLPLNGDGVSYIKKWYEI